ncbi:MAG TPA: DUF1778 domain-containing protein [Rhizobiaceae bacterium]|nr:DUF1778 domain-containing protein [Rhizobiaceae bacterium]
MSVEAVTAEVNIHLRARARDRDLIDSAAEIVGANRSQFMLQSALNEARNVLMDRTEIAVDSRSFHDILARLDKEPSPDEIAGMRRLLGIRPGWDRG